MRALHLIKTSDGAPWAARLARVLRTLGVDVHVALPSLSGRAMENWNTSGAVLHAVDCSLPARSPQKLPSLLRAIRNLVHNIEPDIIHSHFVTTTCALRMALGKSHHIPRVYQVAGPLHLEHWLPRTIEISLAGEADYWIGSTRCIVDWYKRIGIPQERVFLSYYGWFEEQDKQPPSRDVLRQIVGASDADVIVGNVNYLYPPKYYLGQTRGLKAHEDVIDALGEVIKQRPEVLGVFVGGPWGNAQWYERRLHERAHAVAGNRIRFTGPLSFEQARRVWADFSIAVHVPISENCGGVPEPMAAGVPVIASEVGGLSEIVMPGKTGFLVPSRRPDVLALKILNVLEHLQDAKSMAILGRQLVFTMLDADRTGKEVFDIYRHILHPSDFAPPPRFNSEEFVDHLMNRPNEWKPQTFDHPLVVTP